MAEEVLRSIYTVPSEMIGDFDKKIIQHMKQIHPATSKVKLIIFPEQAQSLEVKNVIRLLHKEFKCEKPTFNIFPSDWNQFIGSHTTTHHALVFVGQPSTLNSVLEHSIPSKQKTSAFLWHSVQRPMMFDRVLNETQKVG